MTDAPGALSPLDEAGINAAVEEALAAFAAAGTLAELKEARLAHTGDASSLTLANRLIGTLDKADKPTAGKLLGGARGRIAKALAARQETLEAAAEEQMLRTEAVDVTVPTSRTVTGARHPLDVLVDEVTYRSSQDKPILVGQLYDGTGSIDLVWWGRRRIAGIKPGAHLLAEGRVADGIHRQQIHNPAYQLLGPGQ